MTSFAAKEPRWQGETRRASASLARVFTTTIAALVAPRRLVPITVVVVPLLFLQANYSLDPLALPIAVLMCGAFLLAAPTLWRYFFPLGGARASTLVGVTAYAFAGVVLMFGIGRWIPQMVGMRPTFLTTRPSLLVSVALFWVGGWGLARDVDLEMNLRETEERAQALEREAEHAQLLALKNHLDPHFLYNTLNAIAEWCRVDGRVAEKAIVQLSSMLRTIMTGIHTPSWPLASELALVDSLFEMHRIRDPEIFVYTRDVDPAACDVRVPPMFLLPIAENAMKHGPFAGHRGEVSLRVRADEGALLIELANPGKYTGPRDGGSGIPILQKRLALAYDTGARFVIAGDDARTTVTIRLPREALARAPQEKFR